MADHILVQEWEWDVYSVKKKKKKKKKMVYKKKKKKKKKKWFKKKKKKKKKKKNIHVYMGKRGSHTGVEIDIWYGVRVVAPQ